MADPADAEHVKRRAILAVACDAAAVATLSGVVLFRIFHAQLGSHVAFDPARVLAVSVAAALVLLRHLTTRGPLRLVLAGWATLTAAAACLIILPLFGIDVSARLRTALVPIQSRLALAVLGTPLRNGLYRLDDRYGYVHEPHASVEDGVPYTIDGEGHRVMPAPARPAGTVVVLGDSVTFGWGVRDDEAYPHVLASRYWRDLRVVNAAVDGWGLTQFHLALTDLLATPPYPDAVIVAIIDHDLRRSHLRPPLIAGQRRRLEFIEGTFVSRSMADAPAATTETPDLLEAEAQLARRTFEAMIAVAREKEVPLGVVLLPDDAFPPDVIHALGQHGVPIGDLTRLRPTLLGDAAHPDADGHLAIAGAIAASALRSQLRLP